MTPDDFDPRLIAHWHEWHPRLRDLLRIAVEGLLVSGQGNAALEALTGRLEQRMDEEWRALKEALRSETKKGKSR